MKIREIRCAGLRGQTPEGGWSNELRPEDCVHTLLAVHTDEGAVGLGSVFTNDALVRAALGVLAPLYLGENALEPERVSEKLHPHTFWLGRGGTLTHTISGIDIALWDLLGQATGQPVGRLLGGRHRDRVQPYASLLMDEPARLRERLLAVRAQGFRAFKIGWGPFGRRGAAMDRAIVAAAREAVGPASFCNDLTMPGTWSACMDIGGRFAGTLSGSVNMMGALGAAAAPLAIGLILDSTARNWAVVFWLSGIVYFAGGLCWWWLDPVTPLEQREPSAP